MERTSTLISQSDVQETGSKEMTWVLKNWQTSHEILSAGGASCDVEFENSKVALRLFLRPIEKSHMHCNVKYVVKYYSLCAEIMERTQQNRTVSVQATIETPANPALNITGRGQLNLQGFKKGKDRAIIEEFISIGVWQIAQDGFRQPLTSGHYHNQRVQLMQTKDITIKLNLEMFQVNASGDKRAKSNGNGDQQKESENTLIRHVKAMYAAEENYSDLKLGTKDGMTLSAHKFQLAARSPVFRTMIEEAVNKQGFDGVIKIADMNAKPLIVILHWIYTGELHETAGKVMEDVVEAAIKYQLGDMLKILDKKLIKICTTDNMFQLFQVAKKIPMPTAIEDISIFIKENV